jgi:lipoate-protein ligase A
MERNRTVIERLISCSRRREEAVVFKSEVRSPKSEVTVSGHTDLVIDGRKFSGNSQRRRKHFLLFHGTFLLNFDLALIAEVLRMPSKQPDYRADRSHGDFLANLGVSSTSVKDALREAWRAESGPSPFIQIPESVVEKYESREWRFKF